MKPELFTDIFWLILLFWVVGLIFASLFYVLRRHL